MLQHNPCVLPASAIKAAVALGSLSSGSNPHITIKKTPTKVGAFFMAAGEGFEPSQDESESSVLPLHHPATFL